MIDVLKRTPLYGEHVELGGKLVAFAGWEMPIQYSSGSTAEHRAVRQAAGLFDVSHMGEIFVRGPQALDLVQRVSINDASRIEVGQAQYSAMCLDSGGVIDDVVVYRYADRYMLVVNAANVDKDRAWLEEQSAPFDVRIEDASERTALLALQGPAAREILRPLVSIDLDEVTYYRFREALVDGVPATVSGTGYTGEDGFELYLPAEDAAAVWRRLLERGRPSGLVAAGLGARDSLRLEMGYALYGNDLDEQHTPLESGLGWVTKLDKGPFVGRTALVAQKEAGVPRTLVGLTVSGRGFPRPGYAILSGGEQVGSVTSGTVSPSLGIGIALGYVRAERAQLGARFDIDARGRPLDAVAVRPPFYTQGSIRR